MAVKNLSTGLPNYPQVTFNKRYEGYRTEPSAVPYYRHALNDGEDSKKKEMKNNVQQQQQKQQI